MGVLRKTKSVQLLTRIFEESQEAISAVDLINRFASEMNKTTVYRILDRFEEDGVVHSFTGKDGLRWYAPCKKCKPEEHTHNHPHAQCRDCGKMTCLEEDIHLPHVSGFQVSSAEVLLVGRCEDCAQKN